MQRTERKLCLDGVAIVLDADEVEIDLARQGQKALHDATGVAEVRCCGARCQPLMRFEDGSVVYLHCPPEGEEGPMGYRVESPRPHRWTISFLSHGPDRVARLSWDLL
jgi:hypothetical protein